MPEEQVPQPPNTDAPISLNITDIADAVKIMDYACEQGAFKGWANIRQIVVIRDRLDAFVTSTQDAVDAQNAQSEAPDFDEPPPRMPLKSMPD